MSPEHIIDIKGYEEYYTIDIFGRIFSKRKNRYLKHNIKTDGYVNNVLCDKTTHKAYYVHILVAQHFIDNPNNLPEVNHKNGIKSDNFIDNLEWTTHKDNIIHSYKVLGRIPCSHDNMKKPVGKYNNKGKLLCRYKSLKDAADMNEIKTSNLSNNLNKVPVKCNKRGRVYYYISKTVGGYYWNWL